MTISLEFVKETDQARLFRFANGDEFWIPRSVINTAFKPKQELRKPKKKGLL